MNNVLFTKVKFFRNVKDFKFVPKLKTEQKTEIVAKVQEAISGKMNLVNIKNLENEMIQFLRANRLISNGDSSLFVSVKQSSAIQLFAGEHITIVATGEGFSKSAIENAREMAKDLSNKLSLSFSDEYGYLMSDIIHLGVGLSLECDISLAAIREIGKIDQVKQNMKKLGYNLKSTKNNSVFTLSTGTNLGFSEQEIIDEFEKVVAKLNDLEIESAKLLDLNSHDILLDKSKRSLAILENAHLMGYEELEEIIHNIRTGINAGLIDLTNEKLIKLQRIIFDKNEDFVSESELKELALKVRNILKGE